MLTEEDRRDAGPTGLKFINPITSSSSIFVQWDRRLAGLYKFECSNFT